MRRFPPPWTVEALDGGLWTRLDKGRFQTFDLAFLGSSMRRPPPPWTAEKIKAGSR